MSLLFAHLEQIGYCCQGIDSLPFPPPKIFTNALLSSHDITSLIRDTESHERALFSVPPPPKPTISAPKPANDPATASGTGTGSSSSSARNRRQTVFNVASGEVTTGPPTRGSTHPRRHTAVAAVLGGEMHEKLRRDGGAGAGEVDVEALLRGAEKLCGVYELPGARERIAALRGRFRSGRNTTAYYEARVAEQAEQLAGLERDWMRRDEDDDDDGDGAGDAEAEESEVWTEEDLRREEDEAREMEVKKRELQGRLKTMAKDLGGLMSM